MTQTLTIKYRLTMKVKPSNKLYYRDKLYKLVVSDLTRDKLQEVYKSPIWDQSTWGRYQNIKVRRRYPDTFIYVAEKDQAEAVYKILKPKVVEVYGPINGYHKTLLKEFTRNIDIKKNLYHKKYRYQAIYGLTETKETVDKITNIVYTNKDGYLGQGLYYSLGFTSPRVFVKGDRELMLLKLATEEHIKQVKTVVTIKEIIENEKKVS